MDSIKKELTYKNNELSTKNFTDLVLCWLFVAHHACLVGLHWPKVNLLGSFWWLTFCFGLLLKVVR